MKKIKFLAIFALVAFISIAIINSCDNRVFEPTGETPPEGSNTLLSQELIIAIDINATRAKINRNN